MENKKIVNAPYWKRMLAYFIDAVLALGLGFLLYTFVTSTYLFKAMGGDKSEQKLMGYYAESGLLITEKKEDGTYDKSKVGFFQFKADEKDGSAFTDAPDGKLAYEAYYDKVYDYYTVVLPKALDGHSDFVILKDKDGKDFASIDQYKEYFNEEVFSLPKVTDTTKIDEASRSSKSNPYFILALNEEGNAVDPLARPVLKKEIQDKVVAKDAETIKKLRDYFFDATTSKAADAGIYYNAVIDMMGTSETSVQTFSDAQNAIITEANAMSQVVAFIPCIFVFTFLVPVFAPGGKTIGKLIFNLPVISEEGFSMALWKRILRPLYMAVLGSLLFVPYTISMIAFFVLFLVDALMLGFSRSGLSLHDRIFKTIVVDGKTSMYFKDAASQEDYYEEHPQEREEEEKTEVDYEMEAAIRNQERVLDMETILKNREEARSITSFDEFEAKKEAEMNALKEKHASSVVNLSKEDEKK